MSKEVQFEDYSEKVDRKKVFSDWNAYVRMADRQEGCSGIPGIRWLDDVPVQDSSDAAEKYMESHRKHDYDCVAVRYYEMDRRKQISKKLAELRQRVTPLREKYVSLNNKFHFEGAKSQFVSCKKCGSKLSVKYLGGAFARNTCPLCQADLRPQSTLDRIARAHDAWQKCLADIEAEEIRLAKKAKDVRWLVKIEYHT